MYAVGIMIIYGQLDYMITDQSKHDSYVAHFDLYEKMLPHRRKAS